MKKLIALFVGVVLSAAGFSDEGLKALYRFEEKAGVAIDSSANANHATLMNQPLRVEADGLNVMAFEGDRNTFLNCGNGSALSGKTDFTLSAWIKTSNRPQNRRMPLSGHVSGRHQIRENLLIVECGIWNVECGMWNMECGMWNMECGICEHPQISQINTDKKLT